MIRVPLRIAQGSPARAVAATAVLLAALAAPFGAVARDWTSPRAADAATRAWERQATRTDAVLQAESKAARLAQKAREDEWDRKTRRTTRSICTGATGC
jgi:hypothetical protein